jgi:hypothetical protein
LVEGLNKKDCMASALAGREYGHHWRLSGLLINDIHGRKEMITSALRTSTTAFNYNNSLLLVCHDTTSYHFCK